MSVTDILVPRLAESISEATLVEWLKPDGAAVRMFAYDPMDERHLFAATNGGAKVADQLMHDYFAWCNDLRWPWEPGGGGPVMQVALENASADDDGPPR